ncbi:multidrug efflux system outer membrane protein [Pseudoduganella lurida]|uniref:Multidrug efflux system outer membrane protein n=1 Tax=Pseudoduganella lurida TaxID=1036180 RepID=A0A562RL45_9BURK|nr:efflux transporter outer membrane subunit [Pseudoduganella lurida]TWI69772.1 multidrug efflux system outer membrane protein [Pseudoduganella lurida]
MKTKLNILLLAASAALASGCALQPAYEKPAPAVAAAYPTGPAYATSTAAIGLGAATPPAAELGWADFLVDARLRQLVTVALANNQDLRVALLRVSQARAALQLQRSAALPQVGLEASSSNGRSTAVNSATGRRTVAHTHAVGLDASWEVDLFGRLQSLTESAREQYLATAYGRQAAHILLVSQVADQYLALLSFDEQLAATAQTLEAARESYRIVKLQYDVGTTSELDESQAQGVLQQALANLSAQQRLRAQAENALVLLLGQPLPADRAPATPLEQQAILADVPAGLPSDLLLRRPDILQAEALLRSETADIGAARAAFFPAIQLTAGAGVASTALSGLFKGGAGVWSFAPQLLLPLFDGGARQANLDAARVEREIAVAQYRKAVQTAFREVSDGLAARGTYDSELAARERNVDAQARRVTLAELLYSSGTNDYLTVLTARTDLYNARIALIAARQDRLAALVDLYRALGGGWIERNGDAPAAADAGADTAAPAPAPAS